MANKFSELKESIEKQKKIVNEMISSQKHFSESEPEERKIILEHFEKLTNNLRNLSSETDKKIQSVNMSKPLNKEKDSKKTDDKKDETQKTPEKKQYKQVEFSRPVRLEEKYSFREMRPDSLEKETFRRINKTKKEEKERKKAPKKQEFNPYVKLSNKFFSRFSNKLVDDKTFENLERDLVKSSMKFTAPEYLSTIMFSTVVSLFVAILIAVFFLFFTISPELPIIMRTTEEFSTRILKVFWLIFAVPVSTLLLMFFYPTIEKNSQGTKMDQEMPFATIHMSAISGSMIDPAKIFEILITTKEYPALSKQFTKLINEINIYGYDIVSALRNASYNCPSKKLSELYNGLATTLNSGGDLPEFFEKRSENLLFEYGLEKEKRTKSAETFMDIYISVVIAAPMILMILLMMMKISGLGVSLSTQMITLVMIVSVTVINIVFLSFMEVKK